jgi:tRNA-2-methylthio-N6-dimethylallyladenosine synthase
VQSGSDRLLRLMGRGYDIESYRRLVDDLRRARHGLALSTDLIVGFPGETEEDHRATLQLVESVRFAQVFAFTYSPRPGTAAPRLALPAVDEEVASRRLQELFALQRGIQKELNDELVGRTMEALVTGWGRQEGQQTGRTGCHRVVLFAAGDHPALPGELVTVRIDRGQHNSLLATRLDGAVTAAPAPGRPSLRVLAGL